MEQRRGIQCRHGGGTVIKWSGKNLLRCSLRKDVKEIRNGAVKTSERSS